MPIRDQLYFLGSECGNQHFYILKANALLFCYPEIIFCVLRLSLFLYLSQVAKGDKELSAAVSFAHAKFREDSFLSFRLAGRIGFFITRNVEIEPELTIGKLGDDLFSEEDGLKMGYILSCNLSYHFTPDKKTVPFILAGFGISNSMPYFHNVVTAGMEDKTFKVINAGAGFKLFSGKCFAVRLEYRFQHFFEGGGEFDFKYTYHYGLFGISVFF